MADIKKAGGKAPQTSASTIYDVSRLAGVSTSTVSRSFSRPDLISKATKEKVFAAAKSLNYRPSTFAGSLTTKRTFLIGLLTTDIQNPFVAALARGVQDGAAEQRYLSIICSTDGDATRELDLLEEMLARGVDGFILTPPYDTPSLGSAENLAALNSRGVPVVRIGRWKYVTDGTYVTSCTQEGEVDAVSHLISLGHRRIGFLGGYYSRGVGLGRWQGYQEALEIHGLNLDMSLVTESETTRAGGYGAMQRLLALAEPPSAVVAINDLVAVGAMDASKERGLTVPADLSIIGFDDIPVASFTTPPLTTVAQRPYDIGHTAAELILSKLKNPDTLAQMVRLSCQLVVRGTTAPPSKHDDK